MHPAKKITIRGNIKLRGNNRPKPFPSASLPLPKLKPSPTPWRNAVGVFSVGFVAGHHQGLYEAATSFFLPTLLGEILNNGDVWLLAGGNFRWNTNTCIKQQITEILTFTA